MKVSSPGSPAGEIPASALASRDREKLQASAVASVPGSYASSRAESACRRRPPYEGGKAKARTRVLVRTVEATARAAGLWVNRVEISRLHICTLISAVAERFPLLGRQRMRSPQHVVRLAQHRRRHVAGAVDEYMPIPPQGLQKQRSLGGAFRMRLVEEHRCPDCLMVANHSLLGARRGFHRRAELCRCPW